MLYYSFSFFRKLLLFGEIGVTSPLFVIIEESYHLAGREMVQDIAYTPTTNFFCNLFDNIWIGFKNIGVVIKSKIIDLSQS